MRSLMVFIFESGPVPGKLGASNEKLNANFNNTSHLSQRNAPMASAPLGMSCFGSVFFLACAASAMERASLARWALRHSRNRSESIRVWSEKEKMMKNMLQSHLQHFHHGLHRGAVRDCTKNMVAVQATYKNFMSATSLHLIELHNLQGE